VRPDSGRVVLPIEDALAAPVGGPVAGPGAGRDDTTRAAAPRPWHRRPRWIMLRSVAVPGWGQWANGRHVKAAVVAAGEGYLIWRAVDYGRQERAKGREARLAQAEPTRQAKLLERKRYYGSRRRDFTWWSIFAAALSMGDAYVDAQLGAFDPEFVPQDGTGGFVLDRTAGFRVGLRLRLP
jgi:hypothetical protein